MNFIFMPSLGHIALVKIAITLWYQDDIITRMKKCTPFLLRNKNEPLLGIDDKEIEEYLKVEENVFKKVTQLKLPECLKEKLFGVVRNVGLELYNRMKDRNQGTYFECCKLLNKLCWTSLGKIDKKKSAGVFIRDKSVHIAVRFIVACVNCLEDDVREIWNLMPRNLRAYFSSEELVLSDEDNQLPVIWTYYLKGKLAKLTNKLTDLTLRELGFVSKEMSPYKFGFMYAVRLGNKPATEYFLKKLNPAEREECLMKYECDANHGDVLCFLLSQMNEKEQMTYFRRSSRNTCKVLKCLLEWPLQSFFKETFVTVCELDLLPAEEFYVLLEYIMMKITEDITFMDYNYKELLEQIWLLSSKIYKEHVFYYLAEQRFATLVSDMVNVGNIMVILKDAPIEMREKIIFKHKSCFIYPMYESKWDIIKSLMQECMSSTGMMIKFKNEFFTDHRKSFDHSYMTDSEFQSGQDALNKFSQLIDELINKKRNLEEGECSQAKKPHIIKLVKSSL